MTTSTTHVINGETYTEWNTSTIVKTDKDWEYKGLGLGKIAEGKLGDAPMSKGGVLYKKIKRLITSNPLKYEEIKAPYSWTWGWTLLLPPVTAAKAAADAAAKAAGVPSVSGSFALTSERNVRSAKVKDPKNIIYTAKADPATKFKYSSLFTDTAGLVWAEVDLTAPNNKDNTGKPLTKGWICVKSGADYYTDPKIDMPEPDKG